MVTAVLISVLVAGLFYMGTRLNRSVADIQQLREELVARWSSLSMLANLLTTYNDRAERDLAVLERVIPKRDSLLNLGRDLKSLAVKANVEQTYTFVNEISPADGSLGYVMFRVSVTGTNEDVRAYLKSLDSFTYLSRFETVEMTRSGAKASAAVHGKVFFQ